MADVVPQLSSDAFKVAVHVHGDAVMITDGQLDIPGPTIVYVNPAFAQLTGYEPSAVIGKNPRFMQGPLTDRAVLDRLRSKLTANRRFEGESINYRADGRPFVIAWTIDPVLDSDGRAEYFVALQRDVTEKRQLEGLRLATQTLARDPVVLVDGQSVKKTASAALDKICRAAEQMLLAGRVTVASRVGRDWLTSGDHGAPEVVDLLRRHRQPARLRRSDSSVVMVAPFPDASVPGGLVVSGLDDSSADLVSLSDVAEFAVTASRSLAVFSLMRDRRRETLAVQRVLRPNDRLRLDGFETDVRYLPSRKTERAGGDWYDAVDMGDVVRLVVGDVTGKGLRAAAEMGLVRAHVNALLTSRAALSDVLADADAFCRQEDLMATALLVDVSRLDWSISAVSAGHLPPILAGSDRARTLDLEPNPPLGAFRQGSPRALVTHDDLRTGGLVAFTDGVIAERRSDVTAELGRLCLAVGRYTDDLRGAVDRLLHDVRSAPDDDIAVLAIARRGED